MLGQLFFASLLSHATRPSVGYEVQEIHCHLLDRRSELSKDDAGKCVTTPD